MATNSAPIIPATSHLHRLHGRLLLHARRGAGQRVVVVRAVSGDGGRGGGASYLDMWKKAVDRERRSAELAYRLQPSPPPAEAEAEAPPQADVERRTARFEEMLRVPRPPSSPPSGFQKLLDDAMRPAILAALLLLLAAAASPAAALYSAGSPVLQLSPSNFKKVLNANGVVLVEFFAPWCGHCKQLTPIWEKAAGVLKGVATVAALDADAHKELAQQYGIRGFPTIKVFLPGKPPVDYEGARDVKPIVNFALSQVKGLLRDRLDGKASGGSSGKTSGGSSEKKNEPNESVELNSSNFDELVIKSKDLWIVEFFAPWCGHCKKLAPEWKRAAKNLKGQVKLGHVDCDSDKSLMSKYKVEGFPTILVFGADKESPFPYQGARAASAIESFALEQLEANAAPPEVSELTSADVMEEKCASAAICFVSFLPDILDSKAEGRNKYLELLLSVAEKFKKSPYSFVWAGAGKQADLEKQVGVGGYGYPAMVALNVKKGAYAPLRSAFELAEITEFVKEAGRGGKGNLPLEGAPTVVQSEPWDGKDGEVIEEDEFSLEELMADSSAPNDEL